MNPTIHTITLPTQIAHTSPVVIASGQYFQIELMWKLPNILKNMWNPALRLTALKNSSPVKMITQVLRILNVLSHQTFGSRPIFA